MAPPLDGALKTVAIVPAYNESDRIGSSIDSLRRIGCSSVIVVDDSSTDGTGGIAMAHGARVIRLPRRSGKGSALTRGFQAVSDAADIVLVADGDLGTSAGRLTPLVDAIAAGSDIAIAQFTVPGGFGVAKRMAGRGIRLLANRTMVSPLSGQRALSRSVWPLLAPLPPGWGVEVAMTVRALWAGLDVVEVPIELSHRETGRDWAGFVHRGKQCAAVVAALAHLTGEKWAGRGGRGG